MTAWLKTTLMMLALITPNLVYGAAAIFSGDDVKILKQNLNMNDAAKILSGTDNPTSVAKDAPKGSIYLELTNGDVYKKNDAGSSTNWSKVAVGNTSGINILDNPDFETGIQNWTSTGGTFSHVTSGANLLIGSGTASWTPGASQTLTSDAVTIPIGLRGLNCEASMIYKDGADTIDLEVYDGTNVVASVTLSDTGGTNSRKASVNFICPSSGTLAFRLNSSASDVIVFDQARIGDATNIGTVSQAEIHSAKIEATASCNFTRTSATLGSFGTVAACPGPTSIIGDIASTDADAMKFTLQDVGPGRYEISMQVVVSNSASDSSQLAINDGTTTKGTFTTFFNTATDQYYFNVSAVFEYTTAQGDVTYELFGASPSNTIQVNVDSADKDMHFIAKRFPTASQQVVSLDTTPEYGNFHHESDCSWSAASTSFTTPTGDASCTTATDGTMSITSVADGTGPQPGIKWTPKTAGQYKVCITTTMRNNSAAAFTMIRFLDSNAVDYATQTARLDTTGDHHPGSLCSVVTAPDTSEYSLIMQIKDDSGTANISASGLADVDAISWSVHKITQQTPMPIIVDSVTTAGGNDQFNLVSVGLNTSCGIVSGQELGSWVTGTPSHPSTGRCDLTIDAGTFSGPPNCQCTVQKAGSAFCTFESAPTASAISIRMSNDTGAVDDNFSFITCHGPR